MNSYSKITGGTQQDLLTTILLPIIRQHRVCGHTDLF